MFIQNFNSHPFLFVRINKNKSVHEEIFENELLNKKIKYSDIIFYKNKEFIDKFIFKFNLNHIDILNEIKLNNCIPIINVTGCNYLRSDSSMENIKFEENILKQNVIKNLLSFIDSIAKSDYIKLNNKKIDFTNKTLKQRIEVLFKYEDLKIILINLLDYSIYANNDIENSYFIEIAKVISQKNNKLTPEQYDITKKTLYYDITERWNIIDIKYFKQLVKLYLEYFEFRNEVNLNQDENTIEFKKYKSIFNYCELIILTNILCLLNEIEPLKIINKSPSRNIYKDPSKSSIEFRNNQFNDFLILDKTIDNLMIMHKYINKSSFNIKKYLKCVKDFYLNTYIYKFDTCEHKFNSLLTYTRNQKISSYLYLIYIFISEYDIKYLLEFVEYIYSNLKDNLNMTLDEFKINITYNIINYYPKINFNFMYDMLSSIEIEKLNNKNISALSSLFIIANSKNKQFYSKTNDDKSDKAIIEKMYYFDSNHNKSKDLVIEKINKRLLNDIPELAELTPIQLKYFNHLFYYSDMFDDDHALSVFLKNKEFKFLRIEDREETGKNKYHKMISENDSVYINKLNHSYDESLAQFTYTKISINIYKYLLNTKSPLLKKCIINFMLLFLSCSLTTKTNKNDCEEILTLYKDSLSTICNIIYKSNNSYQAYLIELMKYLKINIAAYYQSKIFIQLSNSYLKEYATAYINTISNSYLSEKYKCELLGIDYYYGDSQYMFKLELEEIVEILSNIPSLPGSVYAEYAEQLLK